MVPAWLLSADGAVNLVIGGRAVCIYIRIDNTIYAVCTKYNTLGMWLICGLLACVSLSHMQHWLL